MKRGFSIVFILFLVQILFTEMSCCDPLQICVVHEKVELVNLDNSGIEAVEQSSDSIQALAFAFDANVSFQSTETCQSGGFDLGFTKTYATSCPTEVTLSGSIVSYSIHTTGHFNSAETGVDITDKFVPEYSLDEFNDFSAEPGSTVRNTYYLFSSPDFAEEHRFVLNYYLSDGSVITDTSDVVVLVP